MVHAYEHGEGIIWESCQEPAEEWWVMCCG
jgi:hypothetical protein